MTALVTAVDVAVLGGGPVGLGAAIDARLRGMDVALIERRPGPVDKACGEGLLPPAVAALRRLGVQLTGQPFRGICYVDGNSRAVADFRSGRGYGVRRTELSDALSRRADEVGVRRITAEGRVDLRPDAVLVAGTTARWCLAADGLHSPTRRVLGLDGATRGRGRGGAPGLRRYGLRRHYRVEPWSERVEVHWAPDFELYVTPVAPDVVGVAVLGPPGPSFEERLAGVPAVARRLAGSLALTGVRGAGPLAQVASRHVLGPLFLVGDAGGYVDALTGEGIAVGLATARAALDCVVAGEPEEYERRWRAATRSYRVLTGALLGAGATPRSRRLIVPAAARMPRLFASVVNRLA